MDVFIQVDDENRVMMVNYVPFDEVNGLHKTEEELLQIGKLVDSLPIMVPIEGKSVEYIYDPSTNTVSVQYVDLLPDPTVKRIMDLESQNAQMLLALVQGGLI